MRLRTALGAAPPRCFRTGGATLRTNQAVRRWIRVRLMLPMGPSKKVSYVLPCVTVDLGWRAEVWSTSVANRPIRNHTSSRSCGYDAIRVFTAYALSLCFFFQISGPTRVADWLLVYNDNLVGAFSVFLRRDIYIPCVYICMSVYI